MKKKKEKKKMNGKWKNEMKRIHESLLSVCGCVKDIQDMDILISCVINIYVKVERLKYGCTVLKYASVRV